MPRIRFLPMDVTVDCQVGETVFEVGWRHEIPIQSACIGKATCGLCRVVIVEGEDNLPPYAPVEEKHLGNTYFITKMRLSCQCVVSGDVTVKLSPKRRRKSTDR